MTSWMPGVRTIAAVASGSCARAGAATDSAGVAAGVTATVGVTAGVGVEAAPGLRHTGCGIGVVGSADGVVGSGPNREGAVGVAATLWRPDTTGARTDGVLTTAPSEGALTRTSG